MEEEVDYSDHPDEKIRDLYREILFLKDNIRICRDYEEEGEVMLAEMRAKVAEMKVQKKQLQKKISQEQKQLKHRKIEYSEWIQYVALQKQLDFAMAADYLHLHKFETEECLIVVSSESYSSSSSFPSFGFLRAEANGGFKITPTFTNSSPYLYRHTTRKRSFGVYNSWTGMFLCWTTSGRVVSTPVFGANSRIQIREGKWAVKYGKKLTPFTATANSRLSLSLNAKEKGEIPLYLSLVSVSLFQSCLRNMVVIFERPHLEKRERKEERSERKRPGTRAYEKLKAVSEKKLKGSDQILDQNQRRASSSQSLRDTKRDEIRKPSRFSPQTRTRRKTLRGVGDRENFITRHFRKGLADSDDDIFSSTGTATGRRTPSTGSEDEDDIAYDPTALAQIKTSGAVGFLNFCDGSEENCSSSSTSTSLSPSNSFSPSPILFTGQGEERARVGEERRGKREGEEKVRPLIFPLGGASPRRLLSPRRSKDKEKEKEESRSEIRFGSTYTHGEKSERGTGGSGRGEKGPLGLISGGAAASLASVSEKESKKRGRNDSEALFDLSLETYRSEREQKKARERRRRRDEEEEDEEWIEEKEEKEVVEANLNQMKNAGAVGFLNFCAEVPPSPLRADVGGGEGKKENRKSVGSRDKKLMKKKLWK